jgi:hypothetical protein
LFPEDAVTKDGDPFWHGSKKFPVVVEQYDPNNETHVSFVMTGANLFACMLKIHPEKPPSEQNDPEHRWMEKYRDVEWLNGVVASLPVPEYVKGGVDDLDDDQAAAGKGGAVDIETEFAKLEQLCVDLEALAGATASDNFEPADFEKDDDDNFHIDFITACSNLRAGSYQIPEAPRHKCKMIAGRIIPAIATTTASVTGLVMLEMYKVLMKKNIDQIKNGQFSLGSNGYTLFEAEPPQKHENHVEITRPDPMEHPDAYDEKGEMVDMYKDPSMMLGFAEEVKYFPNPQTKYDKVWIPGCRFDMTVQELVDKVDEVFQAQGLRFCAASCPNQQVEVEKTEENTKGLADSRRQLYNINLPGTKENLDKPLADLLVELTTRSETHLTVDDPVDIRGRKFYTGIGIDVLDETDCIVNTPTIVLKFIDWEFTTYADRPEKVVTPWL